MFNDNLDILPIKIISHSRRTTNIAIRYGWLPGARYTNLRDIRNYPKIGLIDIDWKLYDFDRHLSIVKQIKPFFTVAKDIEDINQIEKIIEQSIEFLDYCEFVVIVPKINGVIKILEEELDHRFILGYSVPTKYGNTSVERKEFRNFPVHLLGGRPDVQKILSQELNVVSMDGNRLTFDAKFGDYFNGDIFQPHPVGGLYRCIEDSIININKLWENHGCTGGLITERFNQWLMK
jgi:hypothetical protein